MLLCAIVNAVMIMNAFFETDFKNLSIKLCCKVSDEIGTTIHHNRSSHGLVLFLSGESLFEFSGAKELLVKEGQVIYLPKDSTYNSTDAENTECIAVNFDIDDSTMTFPTFLLKKSFGEKYRHLFEKILTLWKKQRVGYMNGCLAVLYEIIFHIQQDVRYDYITHDKEHLLQRAAYYIHDHLSDATLTVEQIARKFDMSPEYLRKLYRAQYGVSPKEYMLIKRIEMAKLMIEAEDIKLSFVPYECGFTDYPYFSRVFKKKVGMSPMQYLKQIKTERGGQ